MTSAVALGLAVVVAAVPGGLAGCRGCRGDDGDEPPVARPRPAPVDGYVGTARCVACHEAEAEAYAGSDHDRAMEEPSADSVEGRFDDVAVEGDDEVYVFAREGDRYVVRVDRGDDAARTYPVAWTFGFDPLQQFLLDVGDGRLQSLTMAWDARPRDAGGQRFYDLYPDEEIGPGDPLHWTGAMQNWNHVCADCHSTAYRKGYDEEAEAFAPSWAEPDVGCEACHGPGARHVSWAEALGDAQASRGEGLLVDLRNGRAWPMSAATHNAVPQPDASHAEVDTCAPCHMRRHQIGEARRPDQPLLDFYRPELLDDPALYHPDGQIDGEVYVYGSFLQSRMFHAGVRCSDCHDPHTAGLRAEGDALCARCHDATFYAAPSHHHHPPGSDGAACRSCHMPAKAYMGFDLRPDHSLRVPRPDLSVSLGVPNACNGCHDGPEDAAWAAVHVASWFGDERSEHYGATFAAARTGDPRAFSELVQLAETREAPAIVRGTALALLGRYGEPAQGAIAKGAADASALVRLGAVNGAWGLAPAPRLAALAGMLTDEMRVLRVEAARGLSIVPADRLRDDVAARLRRAQDELLAAERVHRDRDDAWMRIAAMELDRGRLDRAEAALRRALALAPDAIPPRVNLADLARMRGDEEEAERWLLDAQRRSPGDAAVLHALGLLYVRTDRRRLGVTHLGDAVTLAPGEPRYAYVHVVALWDDGRRAAALSALEAALARFPHDRALLEAARAYREAPPR